MRKKINVDFDDEDSLAVELLFEAIAKTQGLPVFDQDNQDPDSKTYKFQEKYLQQLVKL
ncbi:MAG: hypothetical protein RO257_11920 [Candidatus Kapabacteria bacterium]|nr:hypothetical protein [Candidatus Kapabacteria bacterium]